MKYYAKKVVLLIECLLIIFSLFGCRSNKQNQDFNKDSDEITIMAPLNGIAEPGKDDDVKAEIENLTGEKVNFIWIPKESYKEKSTMMMASGDFPDILVVENETEDIVKGVEQGAFWNIGDYIKSYPNLYNSDDEILKNSSFQGEIYGIYRYVNPVEKVIILRKDWMEKLGLQVPKNPEEFERTLRMFKESDPDDDSLDNTYGLEISGGEDNEFNLIVDQVAAWFGAANGWKEEDGELIPSFMTDEYKKALIYLRNLYEDGLIDKKFYLKNTKDAQKDFAENKCGAIISNQANAIKLESQMRKNSIKVDEALTVISRLQEDENGKVIYNTGYSGMLMFPKKGVKTEEKLKRVLNFIDKLNSKEGYMLLNYGIEGENYTIENGNFQSIDKSDNYKLLSYSEINTNLSKENALNIYESEFTDELKKAVDIPKEDRVVDPTTPLKIKGYINNQQRLEGLIRQLEAKFVFGQISNDQYDEGLNEWLNNEGQDYINKVNDLYKKYNNN